MAPAWPDRTSQEIEHWPPFIIKQAFIGHLLCARPVLDLWVENTDAEIDVPKGLDGVLKRWPCALHSLGAGEIQGTEGPWVTGGFQEKPPGRDITSGRSDLCDPGPGRGNRRRYRTMVISRCPEQKVYWELEGPVSSYRRIFLVCHC